MDVLFYKANTAIGRDCFTKFLSWIFLQTCLKFNWSVSVYLNDIWNQVGNKFSWSRICFANCNGYPDSVMLKSGLKVQILGKTCCIFMNSSHWLLTSVRCLCNACHVILQLLHEWKCNIAIRYNCIITRRGSTNVKAMHKNTGSSVTRSWYYDTR